MKTDLNQFEGCKFFISNNCIINQKGIRLLDILPAIDLYAPLIAREKDIFYCASLPVDFDPLFLRKEGGVILWITSSKIQRLKS
jgi:hypothetical protein